MEFMAPPRLSLAMLKHLWDFALALISQWAALVTGGIVVAVIAFVERIRKKPIAGKLFWAAIIASFFFASFLAWRDERVRVESLHLDRLTLKPIDLANTVRGLTTSQSQKLARVYIGKWIEASGQISDIRTDVGMSVDRAGVTLKDDSGPVIAAVFVKKWTEPISVLRAGERIRLIGQISKIETNWIWLEDCELLEVPR